MRWDLHERSFRPVGVGKFVLVSILLLCGPSPQSLGPFFGIAKVVDPDPTIKSSDKEVEERYWQLRVISESPSCAARLSALPPFELLWPQPPGWPCWPRSVPSSSLMEPPGGAIM